MNHGQPGYRRIPLGGLMTEVEIPDSPAVHPLEKRMRQVGRLVRNSLQSPNEETIHDLRVALRRCRSFAAGIERLDPHKSWKKMLRQSGKLARAVGCLRDTHVLQIWIDRLRRNQDPLADQLTGILSADEENHRRKSLQALSRFDLDNWEFWKCVLPRRAASLDPSATPFILLAGETLDEFLSHHSGAVRTNDRFEWHTLRIILKRFRYIAEDFLTELASPWKESLSRIQDLLGEIHDLDMLEDRIRALGGLFERAERDAWSIMIDADRESRRRMYLNCMTGPKALWKTWKKALRPHGSMGKPSP